MERRIVIDTSIFALTNLTKQYLWNDLFFGKSVSTVRALLSTMLYLGSNITYEQFAYQYKYITGDQPLDQFIYSLGPQLYIGSLLTKDKEAIISDDFISLLAVFLYRKA